MGLFGKKEKKPEELPPLPRLPRLPDLPEMGMDEPVQIHQLPSFPSSSIGAKFSRDALKDAVTGEKDDDFYAGEDEEEARMPDQLRRPLAQEETEISMSMPKLPRSSFRSEAEPVFVRIDRFEEGLKLFETLKDQVSTIEKHLAETKRLKEKEELELQAWESELRMMKDELEKINNNIFSKV